MSENNNNFQHPDACGCCEGVKTLTPAAVENRPGLAALVYRVGAHAAFKQSMLASITGETPLAGLTTREDDDPSIALMDAWAAVLDVLGFYQERIANEGYLRTAAERRSILEMARHIGYRLKPGVAAGTYLAFTMEDAKGAPQQATVSTGAKAQSVPGQDESPQVFETVEDIEARVVWNAFTPRLTIPQQIGKGKTGLYLKSTATQLQPGDAILVVGDQRERWAGSERWDFRILQTVTTNDDEDYTYVTWEEALGHDSPTIEPADNPRVFAFRDRAALFGYNAPEWRTMTEEIREAYDPKGKQKTRWPDFEIKDPKEKIIDLDRIYPKILEKSFIVFRKPKYEELYKALTVVSAARADYGLTSKTTRIHLDTAEHLSWFPLRDTEVFVQSEQLEIAEQPVTTPVFGKEILLDTEVEDLEQDRILVLTGKPLKQVTVAQRWRVIKEAKEEIVETEDQLFLVSGEGSNMVRKGLEDDDLLDVAELPEWQEDGTILWTLTDAEGFTGAVIAEEEDFIPVAAEEDDPTVSEVITLEYDAQTGEDSLTLLQLKEPLSYVYLRGTVTINANVARATHGETKSEILGSGDGTKSFRTFTLKQYPLTYISAATPSGAQTTLEIRVNEVLWEEVSTFYGVSPGERVYITRIADDGKVTVQFGDGITGARLPTGVENVKATYRVGTGLDGQVNEEQISMLMSYPLGVKGVINPLSATGAADPEERDQARQNAPLTVLTLDRIVSLRDYEDFARAYAGIGKARADWVWKGEHKMIHVTVAASDGGGVDTSSSLYTNLTAAIDGARHAQHQVQVDSYREVLFGVEARVKVDTGYITEDVLEDVKDALEDAFSFDSRDFGQPVFLSEIISVIQAVEGVIAVDLESPVTHLAAERADWDEDEVTVLAAQLLTIDTDGIDITEMNP
jgi:uncharacterized phage protein gp47/JayE